MAPQEASSTLLEKKGLAPTPHRVMVLDILADSPSPLSPQEIFMTLKRSHSMNRVTLYRILDLLVSHGIVERIQSGDRAFRYGLNTLSPHARHPHFYCSRCGSVQCVDTHAIPLEVEDLQKTFSGLIEKMEVRLDGICKNCLRTLGRRPRGSGRTSERQ